MEMAVKALQTGVWAIVVGGAREIRSDKSGETYPQTAGGAGGTERNGGIE